MNVLTRQLPGPLAVGFLLGALLVSSLGLAVAAEALDPERRIDQYLVHSWSNKDGLPHPIVSDVIQTRDGYLWLATQGGLARFDGVRFRTFRPRDTPALRVASVKALEEADDGTLWAGSYGGGLVRYLAGEFTAFGTEAGLPTLLVRALAKSADGKLWVGTEDAGVLLFDGERVVQRLGKAEGLPSNFVRALLISRSGDLWLGTDTGGLSRFKEGRLTSWTVAEGLAGQTVTDLLEDRNGALWIATTRGLQRLDEDRLITYGPAQGLTSDYIYSLGEDSDGNLWVGTGGDGLVRYAGGTFSSLGVEDGLPSAFVWDIAEDREGNLWIATEAGLARLQAGPFVMWGRKQGLLDDQVRGVVQTRDDSILVGTPHGLARLSGDAIVQPTHPGLADAYIWSLLETRDGDTWVSIDGVGLARIRDGEITRFAPEDGIGSDIVWSLAEDAQGTIWAGTNQGGLARYANSQWTRIRLADGLGADVVRAVLVDQADDVWAATIGGGLSRIRGDEVTTYTTSDGLGSDTVLALYEDGDAHLWVGTLGGGLSVRLGETFVTLPSSGFAPTTIGSFVEDDQGYLWMGSDHGIRRAERNQLVALARGERSDAPTLGFGPQHGLVGSPGTGFTPTSWKSRDGRLWFTTTQGVGTLDPKQLDLQPRPPPLVIEELLANHEPVDVYREVVLPPGTFDLELRYTAANLGAPDGVRFRYRLKGFDRDWVEVADRRVAYYTNLPPGRFRFEVTAANDDGVWNPVPAVLELRLLPRFYQTWWWKALMVAAALLFLYGLHRLRAGRLELRAAVAEERNRLAREIHDTIAQDLASILIQARVATRKATSDPRGAGERLERITALATGSLAEARSSLLALRSPALEGKDLATALAHTARLLAPDDEPVIDVHSVGNEALAPTVEVELLRVAKEAMTNAVRHSGAHRIKVDLVLAAGEATLRVADDGHGFDPDTATRVGGFGLLGMRERVAALGGTLAILSTPGSGTSIEACVPAAGLAR
jgi:signal transduction histidine kinase/ligand-binding sensor domain-containing protein